ncbi:MAG: MMPL family transporter [Methylophilus sp.]
MTNPSIFAQNRHARTAIMLWLVMVLLSLGIISRSHFTADLSAFLPSHPTAEQQLLMDQLKDGLASRLILVGIEGADPQTRATLSKTIAQKLRVNPAFVSVNNGEEITAERDREYLFKNRYLLSPAVTPEHFSTDGLRTSISDSIDQIASPAGLLTKSLLPHDPTGEMLQLIDALSGSNRPDMFEGAWTSRDGNTALLLLQTSAAGSDTDAQKLAMQAIRAEFDQALNIDPAIVKPTLLMTGPGVFSVIARDTIKMQVRAIFIVSSVLIALLLWAVYRSMTALLLGFLPVATGILAGIASVSLVFGVVHGITLGFGTALIGEAVDYSIYLFMQTAQTGNREQNRKKWVATVWPTVRLGVLTSVFGFASLLMSGFPGLAQLGLYSVAGLITAAAMTRYVLPFLLPANFNIKDFSNSGERLVRYAKSASILRWPAILLVVISGFIVYNHHDSLWNTELSALSPVSAADQALDARLRGGMGAPDVRYVIVVSGDSQETVLRHTEQISLTLQGLVDKGVLAGFDTASHYLPSQATQQARLDSLPDSAELKSRLNTAVKGLPIKAALLEPFLQDVQSQRAIRLLQRTDLQGSSMAMALDAMLLQQGQHWSSLIPLTMPVGNDIDAVQVRKVLSEVKIPNALFVDMKAESNRLYSSYMQEAILLSLAGVLAIIGLLLITLHSIKQLVAIIIPLVAAVLTVMAGLSLVGQQLIILHLIGLLLIVAIGSNYALFFNPNATSGKQAISSQTYASLVFANIATVLGFGLLAFSTVPVLQAMGVTVAPGVILALIFSAVFARKAGP